MKEFFKVTDLEHTLKYSAVFPNVGTEFIELHKAFERILAVDIISDINLPDFARSTMDGYAVKASSTFGATEENPAYLTVKGTIDMGKPAGFSIGSGEAANISTGGMLSDGLDSVIMVEYTEIIDNTTIEIYKSVAPAQHVLATGEDIKKGDNILSCGQRLRHQEIGLLAALGKDSVKVYKKPKALIIPTGSELVDWRNAVIEDIKPGQALETNSFVFGKLIESCGGSFIRHEIVKDDMEK